MDEILIPAANVTAYKLVYEAETWLRRICLTAMFLAEGPAWASSIEPALRAKIEDETKRNGSRWYLGVDAEEELLWSTTHGQLAQLLLIPTVDFKAVHLCGVSGEVLSARLRSIAQIRNALAHNRAISDDTLSILEGDLTVLHAAVRRFKAATLYADSTWLRANSSGQRNDGRIVAVGG